jgi:hypothetical protein
MTKKSTSLGALIWGSILPYSGKPIDSTSRVGDSVIAEYCQSDSRGADPLTTAKVLGLWLRGVSSPRKSSLWPYGSGRNLWSYTSDMGYQVDWPPEGNPYAAPIIERYLQGNLQESLTLKASRKLNAGCLIDFEVRAPHAKVLPEGRDSALRVILAAFDRVVTRNEPADEWVKHLDHLLEQTPTAATSLLSWLEAKQRQPRILWYCIYLLQSRPVTGLDRFVLHVLDQRNMDSEATIGATIAARQIRLSSVIREKLRTVVLDLLTQFQKYDTVIEDSLAETLLSELLDTAAVLGAKDTFYRVVPFWNRRWTFKVRLRSFAAAQALVTRYADSFTTNEQLLSKWAELSDIIRSLVGAYKISNTSRALIHRALDLFVARLGPESEKISEILEQAPELKRSASRSVRKAEAALKDAGKTNWLESRESHFTALTQPC